MCEVEGVSIDRRRDFDRNFCCQVNTYLISRLKMPAGTAAILDFVIKAPRHLNLGSRSRQD